MSVANDPKTARKAAKKGALKGAADPGGAPDVLDIQGLLAPMKGWWDSSTVLV